MNTINKNCQYVFLSTNELSKEDEICNTAYGFAISGKDGIGMGHHLYIISDDEINHGDYFYSKAFDNIRQSSVDKYDADGCDKVIATTNPELHSYVERGVSNEFVEGVAKISQSDIEHIISLYNEKGKNVDVDKLAEKSYENGIRYKKMNSRYPYKIGYGNGYNQCLQDNADKKFTLQDLKESYNEGRLNHKEPIQGWDNFIRPLLTKKFDLEDMRKIMNIGMSLRQDQLNGYAGKSGEEHLQEYARCLDQEQPKKDTIMVEYENELCNDVLDEGTNYKEFVEQRLKVKDGCIVIVR